MKMILARCVLIALLLQITTAPSSFAKNETAGSAPARTQNVPATQPAGAGKGGEIAALEKKLLGTWYGPDCGGDYTFNADGTFKLEHFTPGGNTLTGTWSIRWDALPPTLVVMCTTSDFKKRAPNWPEYEYLGKPLELKILELSSEVLVYRSPSDGWTQHASRTRGDGGFVTRE